MVSQYYRITKFFRLVPSKVQITSKVGEEEFVHHDLSSIIHNGQKVEATLMSLMDRWIKQKCGEYMKRDVFHYVERKENSDMVKVDDSMLNEISKSKRLLTHDSNCTKHFELSSMRLKAG